MKRNVLKWLLNVIVMGVFLLMVAGCGGQDTTVTMATATANGIVTGKVVDSSTLQPVKNADVVLIANGVKISTKSNASDDPDVAGAFVFTGISATSTNGSGHTLRISAPGFATTLMNIAVAGSADNTPVTTSLGNISLGKGVDLTVIATDQGTPVAGVTINASQNWYSNLSITAVTDADGKAVLKGLCQDAQYMVTSAPFYDGNGNLKYVTSPNNYISYNPNSDRTVSLALVRVGRNDAIQIVASNLLPDGTSYQNYYPYPYNQRVITPDGVIKLVFNYPVTLSGTVTATYVNDQVASTDPNYGKVIPVTTVSASLDQTGTILTITNSAPYLKGQTYTFNGTVTAVVNSQVQTFSLNGVPFNPYFNNNVYIADNTVTGLTPLSALKADNFNGRTGATATTVPSTVYVEFPEKVYGTYSVLSTRSGNATTPINGATVTFGFADGSVVYAANFGGADSATVFRLPIYSVYLPDNSATNINEVTIFINATDAEGNNFSKTVTLPVQ